jgi:23S rRNA (cytosine1962-C5)-methyltransferase
MSEKISNSQCNILNLFGYTGAASLVCAAAGAKVTHVDASKPAISWARENQRFSHLEDRPIRWIMDDCLKFVAREIKRGVKYDGIIMDPPVYGHGPTGEVWDFQKSFPELVSLCRQVLTPSPLFFLVNAYAISSSAIMLKNVLSDHLRDLGGRIEFGEIAIEEKIGKRLLSTGIFSRWMA